LDTETLKEGEIDREIEREGAEERKREEEERGREEDREREKERERERLACYVVNRISDVMNPVTYVVTQRRYREAFR
jgi:hypothetical protein